MSLKELEGALDRRYAEKMSAAHKAEVEVENFIRGARATNSKIKRFIKLLRRDDEYKAKGTGGVFIDLGSQVNWEGLPDIVADYLGKREKKDLNEHVMVSAHKKNGAHYLLVHAGTNGTDRYIEVKTTTAWDEADIKVDFYQANSSLADEPQTVRDAYIEGTKLTLGADSPKERLIMGEKLVGFAIREAARVMSPS